MHIVYGLKSFGIENLSQTQIAFLLLPSIVSIPSGGGGGPKIAKKASGDIKMIP